MFKSTNCWKEQQKKGNRYAACKITEPMMAFQGKRVVRKWQTLSTQSEVMKLSNPSQIKSVNNRGTFDASEDVVSAAYHGSPHIFDGSR